jgi:hypothetical protein
MEVQRTTNTTAVVIPSPVKPGEYFLFPVSAEEKVFTAKSGKEVVLMEIRGKLQDKRGTVVKPTATIVMAVEADILEAHDENKPIRVEAARNEAGYTQFTLLEIAEYEAEAPAAPATAPTTRRRT